MEYVSLDALEAIQSALQWVFNEIFVPVLKDVFNIIFYTIGDLLRELFAGLLLKAWVALLKFVNFLESIFNIFSGYTQVYVNNVSTKQGLLQYLFGLNVVQRAVMIITAISFVLAFISTGIAVVRSMADSIGENRRPISTVLREALKTALTFMLIPFACFFAVEMVTQVLVQINHALTLGNSNTTLGDSIFYTIAQSHWKRPGYEMFASGRKFENIELVEKYFNYAKFDFLVAIIVTVFMMVIMLTTILQFIQRLMMILILYITSPIFAARMPLDEGKSFKTWKDSFVAFLISAFSPIIAMRLYMMTLPILIGGKIQYPAGVNEMLLKLLLVLGGSFAIYTSRNMLVKLYNPQLGEQLDANSFMVNWVVGRIGMELRDKLNRDPRDSMKPGQLGGGESKGGGAAGGDGGGGAGAAGGT